MLKQDDCPCRHVPSIVEVFFGPPLEGGLDGGGVVVVDGSDNKGSRPTGTRFNSVGGLERLDLL